MAKEQEMADQDIDNIDETAGSESLHPNSRPAGSDPKSKLETISKIVSAAHDLPIKDLCKWYDDMIAQYPAVGLKNTGDANANRNSNNMKAGGKPLAPMGMEKIKAPSTSVNVKEDMDKLFDGSQLTEESKTEITALFEAAVNARVGLVQIDLQEQYEAALAEEVEAFISETDETISDFLNYAVEKWIAENEVAIVDTLRLENAEQFMHRLKGLFVESYFDVPEERVDIVHEMTEANEALEGELSEALQMIADLRGELREKAQAEVMADITEGMTMVDAEKLGTLVENIEFTDVASYTKKVSVIKEKYFAEAPKSKGSADVETLNEHNLGVEEKVVVDNPLISQALRLMDASRA